MGPAPAPSKLQTLEPWTQPVHRDPDWPPHAPSCHLPVSPRGCSLLPSANSVKIPAPSHLGSATSPAKSLPWPSRPVHHLPAGPLCPCRQRSCQKCEAGPSFLPQPQQWPSRPLTSHHPPPPVSPSLTVEPSLFLTPTLLGHICCSLYLKCWSQRLHCTICPTRMSLLQKAPPQACCHGPPPNLSPHPVISFRKVLPEISLFICLPLFSPSGQ